MDAGALYGLAPGYDPKVVEAAADAGLPFAPGIMTPSDISLAAAAGCRLMKFFPAAPAGGPSMLRNIAAPFAHMGLRFIPTGGVKYETMEDWLKLSEIAAVGVHLDRDPPADARRRLVGHPRPRARCRDPRKGH